MAWVALQKTARPPHTQAAARAARRAGAVPCVRAAAPAWSAPRLRARRGARDRARQGVRPRRERRASVRVRFRAGRAPGGPQLPDASGDAQEQAVVLHCTSALPSLNAQSLATHCSGLFGWSLSRRPSRQ